MDSLVFPIRLNEQSEPKTKPDHLARTTTKKNAPAGHGELKRPSGPVEGDPASARSLFQTLSEGLKWASRRGAPHAQGALADWDLGRAGAL